MDDVFLIDENGSIIKTNSNDKNYIKKNIFYLSLSSKKSSKIKSLLINV